MARSWAFALLLLTVTLVSADGIYNKNSPVLQVTGKTYDSIIAQSNHTSIVEFYAPWCGHCQNLKPAYEKAAKNLAGLAKVAAVNCDDKDLNEALCAQMGVKGFPTLKIVRPGTEKGRPVIEDYQGPRTTKGIVDAVVDKIPNHVKKLQDGTIEEWLSDSASSAKAILFTEKGTTSALIRSLAIDFLGSIDVGQIRSKETEAVEKYGITDFPSIVLLPSDGQNPIIYTDEMKKEPLMKLFSQVASPNPDPAPAKGKASKSTKDSKSATKKASSASASFSKASEAHKSSDFEDHMADKTIKLEDDTPTESPLPIVDTEKPMVVTEIVPEIASLPTAEELDQACFTSKSRTCILVLLPAAESDAGLSASASQALLGFADISDKHNKRRDHTFPFYSVPAGNTRAATIRGEFGLKDDSSLEVIAVNNKRGWWRHYTDEKFGTNDLENFVDLIKLGGGTKSKLPEGFGSQSAPSSSPPSESTPEPEPEVEQETQPVVVDYMPTAEADPEAVDLPQPDHDEL